MFARRSSIALRWALGAALCGACSVESSAPVSDPTEELSGGDTTVFDTSRNAYSLSARNLDFDQRQEFLLGNNFFSDRWVMSPSSVTSRDGLGPLFNASACSGCHLFDGRGQPPANGEALKSMLVRLSVPGADEHGGPLGEARYGGQLQPFGVQGVPAEATVLLAFQEEEGAYADGTPYSLRRPHLILSDLGYGDMDPETLFSVRAAPAMIGLGLLEAIPASTLESLADPDDRDGDGISGRLNRVWSASEGAHRIGRFGWKAGQPTVRDQVAAAFAGDMGITTSIATALECTEAQTECMGAPNGGEPECEPFVLDAVVFYSEVLAVPARRDVDQPQVRRGQQLFADAGCASCHVPLLETGEHAIVQLADQTIRPYTDLLLHDMGDELADHRPEFEANGREWRTPPLWGVGLLENVSRHEFLLHDGRARGFAEAILWHGGEAQAARDAFASMSVEERGDMIRFLESL